MKYRTIVADPPWQVPRARWREGKLVLTELPYPTMTIEEIMALPVGEFSDTTDQHAHLYLWTTSEYLPAAFGVVEAWGFEYSVPLVWCKERRGFQVGGTFASNVEFILFCQSKAVLRPDTLQVTTEIARLAALAGVTKNDVNRFMGTTDMGGWWLSRLEHRCAVPTNEQLGKLKALIPGLETLEPEIHRINAGKNAPPPAQIDSRWFQWARGPHSRKPEAFLDMVEQVSPGPYLELFARRNRLGWDTWGNESLEHVTL